MPGLRGTYRIVDKPVKAVEIQAELVPYKNIGVAYTYNEPKQAKAKMIELLTAKKQREADFGHGGEREKS